jgi:hypothetical protein
VAKVQSGSRAVKFEVMWWRIPFVSSSPITTASKRRRVLRVAFVVVVYHFSRFHYRTYRYLHIQ